MKKTYSLLKFIFSVMFGATLVYIGISYALNTADSGYQFTPWEAKYISLSNGSCVWITNNATNRFVPTKTMWEWNSFNAVAWWLGVSVYGCPPPIEWHWTFCQWWVVNNVGTNCSGPWDVWNISVYSYSPGYTCWAWGWCYVVCMWVNFSYWQYVPDYTTYWSCY